MLIFFAFRWSFADHTRVPTGSMEPTIAVGDHLVINKLAYDFKIPFTQFKVLKIADPEAGDIVTFTPPHDPKTTYVKRLIAGPGDKVEVKDGFVILNGKSLVKERLDINQPIFSYKESLNGHTYTVDRNLIQARPEHFSVVVPKDKYFFMGDNRDNSLDSRIWGFVDRSQILAKAERVLFSVRLENYLPKLNLNRTLKALD